MTQGGEDQGRCLDSLSRLDVEVLDQVVSRLGPEDIARLGCTSQHLRRQVSSGRHALQLWCRHCRDLLGELPIAHVAASCKSDAASTWLQLYASARMLDRLHWSQAAPHASKLTLISHASNHAPAATMQQDSRSVPADAAALLARTGHTATAAGRFLVLMGGDLRDGPTPEVSDVAVLDLPNSRVIQPRLHGQEPPSLREHCTVLLQQQPGPALDQQVCSAVAAALQEQQAAALDAAAQLAQQVTPTGHTFAVFGGLLPDGSEQPHSSDQLHILWLHPDATWGVWLHPSTTGHAPAPRAFACCAGIRRGTQLLVYGGAANGSMAGTVHTDVGLFDGCLLLCVYILDTDSLHWSLQPTRPLNEPPRPGHVMLGISTCPGPRKRALSCLRVNPVSEQQEFMLLGGCGVDGLADFVPYSLNLQTFYWTKGPVMGYLPPSCSSCSVMRITPSWLLLIGGKGPSMQPQRCIQRLHPPTLSWRPPIDVAGGSSSASNIPSSIPSSMPSRTLSTAEACPQGVCGAPVGCEAVGCATEACVLLGGLEEGAYGRNIVPRLQVLLPGRVIPAAAAGQGSRGVGNSPTAGSAHTALTALSGHLVHTHLLNAHHHLQEPHQKQQQQQHGPQGQQQATRACHCGSCCSCSAASAAAAGASGAPPSQQQQQQQTQQQQQQQQQGRHIQDQSPNAQQRKDRPTSATASGMQGKHGPGGPGQYTNAGSQQMPGAKSRPGANKCLPACLQDPSLTLNGLQGPTGWSGEFEIEPAPAPPQAFSKVAGGIGQGQQQGLGQLQGCGPLGGDSNAGCSVGGGGGGNAGSERVWQMHSSSSRSSERWGLQTVLALVVVLVGLILMAPSVLLHRSA